MKIKGLHPEHRHRRLIEEIRKIRNPDYFILLSLLILVILYVLYDYSINGTIWLFSIISLIFQFHFAVYCSTALLSLIIIIELIKKIYLLNYYSAVLKTFWIEKLFIHDWIILLVNIDKFSVKENQQGNTNKILGIEYYSSSSLHRKHRSIFKDYFDLKHVKQFTIEIIDIYSDLKQNDLVYLIGESKKDYSSILIGFTILLIIIFLPLIVVSPLSAQIVILLVIFCMICITTTLCNIKRNLVKQSSAEVLRAILCALYLRDPDHEITDQRVLGIPSYINYKSLVQLVDSYMIESSR